MIVEIGLLYTWISGALCIILSLLTTILEMKMTSKKSKFKSSVEKYESPTKSNVYIDLRHVHNTLRDKVTRLYKENSKLKTNVIFLDTQIKK